MMALRRTVKSILSYNSCFKQANLIRERASVCCSRCYKSASSCNRQVQRLHSHQVKYFTSVPVSNAQEELRESNEPDKLYRAIDVYIKGHEDSVLESYSQFAAMAAHELGIKVDGILKPKMILDRVTLLRSVFVHKKHREQYEAQTHKRVVQLKHLTGSTADTYLSYLQINIPAGVAMEVHKWEIERLPNHLVEAMEKNLDNVTEEDEAVAMKFMDKMKESKASTEGRYEEYKTTKPYLIGTHG